MKIFLPLTLFIFWGLQVVSQTKIQQQIINVLAEQDEAWNRGDIEGFMQTYWKNDSLMFIGKSGATYGWQNTLNNYKKGYPDTASMGKLHFTLISIQKLSRKYYSVVGKWHLQRTKGDLQGHFTLLLRKIRGKWVIVQDHSS
jgi:ketosteroid isomerase-like protein